VDVVKVLSRGVASVDGTPLPGMAQRAADCRIL
jgi:hypothetical protein